MSLEEDVSGPDPVSVAVFRAVAKKVFGSSRAFLRVRRAIRASLKAAGLSAGVFTYTVGKWLDDGGLEELARNGGADSLRQALQTKMGSAGSVGDETAPIVAAGLHRRLDAVNQGVWVAELAEARHGEIRRKLDGLDAEAQGELSNYATIRTGAEIGSWIEEHERWATLNSHLTNYLRPPYGWRQHDRELDARLLEAACSVGEEEFWKSTVILRGVPKSGKTRSLLEAIGRLSVQADLVLIQPDHAHVEEALRIVNTQGIYLAGEDRNAPPNGRIHIVLLDDLQSHLGVLEPSTILQHPVKLHPRLHDWLHTPDQQVVVIAATTWPHVTRALDPLRVPELLQARFLDVAVAVSDVWTEAEFGALDETLRATLEVQASTTKTNERAVGAALVAKPALVARLEGLTDLDDHELKTKELAVVSEARMGIVTAALAAALQGETPDLLGLKALFTMFTRQADARSHYDDVLRWATTSPVGGAWAIVQTDLTGDKPCFNLADFLWLPAVGKYGEMLTTGDAFVESRTQKQQAAIVDSMQLLGYEDGARRMLQILISKSESETVRAAAMAALGALEGRSKKIVAARDWLKQAIEAGNVEARLELGRLEVVHGRADVARKEFEQAITHFEAEGDVPNRHMAIHRLARLERDVGNTKTARRLLRKIAPGASTAAAELGVLELRRGHIVEGRKWLELAADSGMAKAMLYLGLWELKFGKRSLARDWLQRAVDVGNTDAMRNLAVVHLSDGLLDDAIALLDRAASKGNAAAGHTLNAVINVGDKPKTYRDLLDDTSDAVFGEP